MIAAALTLWCVTRAVADAPQPFLYEGVPSQIAPAPTDLGDEWALQSELVIDDVDQINDLPPAVKDVAKTLVPLMKPHGVRSIAEYHYHTPGKPGSVFLRIFVFETPEKAASFTKPRWFDPKFASMFKPVEGVADEAVDIDNADAPKRNVRLGNLVLTARSVPAADTHLAALELVLKKAKKRQPKSQE